MDQAKVSEKNSQFWNELCGSQLARSLGITDSSRASLEKFDHWYFDFYPYLFDHIPFQEVEGKKVLEVGLGYGTVAQRLSESGAVYTGLDIAAGPVGMVNHRLVQAGLPGRAVQGSILEPPNETDSFDVIVAIGCLHHTGDLELAMQRCWELLRPGGRLIFMVYYAYSYRRIRIETVSTIRYLFNELKGYRGVVGKTEARERVAYDMDSEGCGAPHTDWISVRSLEKICKQYSSFKARLENIDQEPPFSRIPRANLLATAWPRWVGLDLYAVVSK